MKRKPAWSVAFTILLALVIALPISSLLSILFPIAGKVKLSADVEAKQIENFIILVMQHAGGDCVYFDLDGSPSKLAEGKLLFSDGSGEKILNWTFERPDRFCEGDLAWASVRVTRNLRGENIFVEIWIDKAGIVFNGFVTVR